ncbi:p21-C-terminal region-binding protein-domain-containing protein [Dipodascopsis uninucleata]
MSKRKDLKGNSEVVPDAGLSSDEEQLDNEEVVNVDFDFFDLKPDIDFHAIRNLLRQLFDSDNVLFDLSGLADLILSQSTVGSTVKTDGIESDPFAFLTVINASQHKDHPAIAQIIDYILLKTKKDEVLNGKIKSLFAANSKSQTGILFGERLINMPVEVIPPMYRMLYDEAQKVVENDESFKFDYYLLISKSFTETISKLDEEDLRPKKKKKSEKSKETFYFHPEDAVIQAYSEYSVIYHYSKETQEADSKRTFQDYGILPQGQIMLIKADSFKIMIDEMWSRFAVPE